MLTLELLEIMDTIQWQDQYESFSKTMAGRLADLEIDVNKYIFDHVCYRVATAEEFPIAEEWLRSISHVCTKRTYHQRIILCYVLRQPLKFANSDIYSVEFSEPGGSDDYATGFQHFEILTKTPINQLSPNPDKLTALLFEGKFGDETYLKWPDKMVIKTTLLPILIKSISDPGTSIIVNP